MNHTQLVSELEDLARQLGVQLRYEKGDFEGGFCILKDQRVLVVNKRLNDLRKASSLGQALSQCGIDAVYIKPGVREFIEDEVAKANKLKLGDDQSRHLRPR